MKKRLISLSVDNHIYSRYAEFCNKKGWIISKQIENFMKDMLAKKG